jgi:hypothetical protein
MRREIKFWLRTGTYLAICAVASAQNGASTCRSVRLVVELKEGQSFERRIGNGLVFRLAPVHLGPKGEQNGWQIGIVAENTPSNDYAYPVNPPLRFNGLQTLGPSYGDNARTSLSQHHDIWFLLNKADFDRVWPALNSLLWAYSAAHPDAVTEEYGAALKNTRLGYLKLKAVSYKIDPASDSIRQIKVGAEFIVPYDFAFTGDFTPKAGVCPVLPAE